MAANRSTAATIFTYIVAIVILLTGGAMLAGGVRLLTLGGSAYYAISGVALLAVAFLLWRGKKLAAILYGLFLLATWIWALWESGGNGWALLPRVALFTGIGLFFLLPWTGRHLGLSQGLRRTGLIALVVILAAGLLALVASLLTGHRDGEGGSDLSAVAFDAVPTEWLSWGKDQGGARFADVGQITPDNVGALEVAWTYETGAAPMEGGAPALAFEVTPLKIGETLYGCTPHNIVFALDAATGKELWRHDPQVDQAGLAFANCRGVAYADLSERGLAAASDSDGDAPACVRRLYMGTIDARLLSIDAETGKPCPGFGDNGAVSMRKNIGPHEKMYYYYTSAPTVSGNVVVIGSYGFDGQILRQPSGVVRAYDLTTGRQSWDFDPAQPDRTEPMGEDELYEPGSPNSWSVSSTDEELGLVYVPFGVATPDYYGGERTKSGERFSNAIVALDNKTGEIRWEFQTVHHDIWDYDIASQPMLADIELGGKQVAALISISKTGDIFVLDRATGKPLSRVVERRVPAQGGPGERVSPTQPFSIDMPDFAGGRLTERQMWGLTPFDQLWCRIEFRSLRYDGRYTPPSLKGSLQYPGFAGGVNWGGFALDRERNLLLVSSNRLPTKSRLITPEEAKERGMKPMGKGVASSPEAVRAGVPQLGARFAVLNGALMSPLSVPCLQPPVGQLTAVDLSTKKVAWQRPLGTADRMGPMGMQSRLPYEFGLPVVGGAVATGGGVTFIAATPDKRFHAFDTRTGKLLWRSDLPANGNANPMSYVARDGRQYVVIAAGGSGALATNERNVLVAYALPKK